MKPKKKLNKRERQRIATTIERHGDAFARGGRKSKRGKAKEKS